MISSSAQTSAVTNGCVMCPQKLTGKQTRFCSDVCQNKNNQSYIAQQKRGLKRKLQLVSQRGEKCARCGYEKNIAAFAFHHRNPSHKNFALDLRALSNRTWATILVEAEKCDLLCLNCHAKVHPPNLDMLTLTWHL